MLGRRRPTPPHTTHPPTHPTTHPPTHPHAHAPTPHALPPPPGTPAGSRSPTPTAGPSTLNPKPCCCALQAQGARPQRRPQAGGPRGARLCGAAEGRGGQLPAGRGDPRLRLQGACAGGGGGGQAGGLALYQRARGAATCISCTSPAGRVVVQGGGGAERCMHAEAYEASGAAGGREHLPINLLPYAHSGLGAIDTQGCVCVHACSYLNLCVLETPCLCKRR